MRSTRLRAVAVLALLVLAAGCGGDDDSGSDPSGGSASESASDSSSESADGSGEGGEFAEQSGNDIAEAAKADMKELEAVHYAGEITSGGSSIALDVQASAAGDCTGSVSLGEGTAEVLATGGENWFRPDEAFWRQQSPDQADQIIAAVGDKWLIDSDGSFAQFCDLDAFFDNIFSSEETAEGDYEVTGTEELDGQQVVTVAKADDAGTSTGYVVVAEPHYLLKIERSEGDQPGAVEFSEFDEAFEVEAPADDQVVDPATL